MSHEFVSDESDSCFITAGKSASNFSILFESSILAVNDRLSAQLYCNRAAVQARLHQPHAALQEPKGLGIKGNRNEHLNPRSCQIL